VGRSCAALTQKTTSEQEESIMKGGRLQGYRIPGSDREKVSATLDELASLETARANVAVKFFVAAVADLTVEAETELQAVRSRRLASIIDKWGWPFVERWREAWEWLASRAVRSRPPCLAVEDPSPARLPLPRPPRHQFPPRAHLHA
jgi:hypothetical protein